LNVFIKLNTGFCEELLQNELKILMFGPRFNHSLFRMTKPEYPTLTAYSAIAGGAAKTNSEGGESLYTKAGGYTPTQFYDGR
jgi:hypothetical protein